jgi:hypothetical protein
MKGKGGGQFSSPMGLSFDHDILYVADYGNNRVQLFDIYGKYLRDFSSYESNAADRFDRPTDVAGLIFVCFSLYIKVLISCDFDFFLF